MRTKTERVQRSQVCCKTLQSLCIERVSGVLYYKTLRQRIPGPTGISRKIKLSGILKRLK